MYSKEILKVAETTDFNKANKYIACRWSLCTAYKTDYYAADPTREHQTIHYVLAWFVSAGETPVEPDDDPSTDLDDLF